MINLKLHKLNQNFKTLILSYLIVLGIGMTFGLGYNFGASLLSLGLINSKMFGTYATDGFQSPALSFQSIGGGGGTGGSLASAPSGQVHDGGRRRRERGRHHLRQPVQRERAGLPLVPPAGDAHDVAQLINRSLLDPE